MRQAVYTFRGDRLRSARLFRGMTITELASKAEVSKQAISQFENGKSEPKVETLGKLRFLLQFPPDYFYDLPGAGFVVGDTYFRSLSSTTSKERQRQIEYVKLLAGIYRGISEYIDFPKLNLYSVPEKLALTHDVERIAKEARRFFGVGEDPILNIIDLIERNGVIVNTTLTGGDSIDAFSQVMQIDGETYAVVILGDDKECAFRRNFNVAHELGHLLLDDFYNLSELSNSEYNDMEKEMNCFAGAFLIPERPFRNDLSMRNTKTLQTYLSLKEKYMVSAAALIVRAKQLGIIDYATYQNLMKIRSKKGYRICEPGDRETAPLQPLYLKTAMKMLFEEDRIGSREFIGTLSRMGMTLSSSLVESILNLRRGYLSQNDKITPVISLKQKLPDMV